MPDSQPNYLTTAPDGTVGAKFTGEIAAKGVRLDAIESQVGIPENPHTGPAPNRVEWRDILELIYARFEGRKVGNDSQVTLSAMRNDGLSDIDLVLATTGDVSVGPAELAIWATGIGQQTIVRTVLDSDGRSDFVQGGGITLFPRIALGTTASSGQIAGGWNWQPSVPGRYFLAFFMTAYSTIHDGQTRWLTVNIDGAALDSASMAITGAAAGVAQRATLLPAMGMFDTGTFHPAVRPVHPVQIVNSGNINTAGNFDWAMGVAIPA